MEAKKTAAELLAEAAAHDERASESFERCDTDGFLSQWASGLSAERCRTQAKIEAAGGTALFPGLFVSATGERVPAKLIEGRYGQCWAVCDPASGQFTGTFYPSGARSRKQRAAGLEEREESAPAKAVITGRGTGLSGSAWVAVIRTDGGYPGAK